ncbi:MAG TPA: hypothetical protein VFY71_10530 [Planctomycetota bacterium]|nr:hypothetical protein [Planctomycetota bacterium]
MARRAGPARRLAELVSLRLAFGPAPAARRRELLAALGAARLSSPRAVERFHEALCWSRAYPDDRATLALVERLLDGFESRPDLRAARAALQDSGIAGTAIHYPFFTAMAEWLAARWPERLAIDWSAMPRAMAEDERLDRLLQPVSHYAETMGLDEVGFSVREWLARLRGASADATYLLRGLRATGANPFVREYLWERLGLQCTLQPGPGGPSRTHARHAPSPVHFRTLPLRTARPDLRAAVAARPRAVRAVPLAEGRALIDLAREAMVTRSRDLDVFSYGDPRDVRLVDWGEGLQFALIGFQPERRLMLETVYGALTLQSGVPIGYVLYAAFLGSTETAYNVFETNRGGEAAHVYGRVLATARQLLGADTFTVMPYQLGDQNEEAIESGAWWFYQKLGFRPKHVPTLRTMRHELAAMRRGTHRSTAATLRRLARECTYYHLAAPRRDVIGLVDIGNVGLHVTALLAARAGGDRQAAARECAGEAAALLGARPQRWTPDERLWFGRWAPLVLALPGVRRWPARDRRALAAVVRLKGARRESDFAVAFAGHRRLRAAVLALSRREA